MRYLRLMGVSIGVLPAMLGATTVQPDSSSRLPVSGIGTSTTLEIAAVLVGIIMLILILGWLIKRIGRFPTAGKGIVRILGGVSLGPRERVVVLEAGDKRILVGVAPGRVQTLCLLDNGTTEDGLAESYSKRGEFSSQLDAQLQDETK